MRRLALAVLLALGTPSPVLAQQQTQATANPTIADTTLTTTATKIVGTNRNRIHLSCTNNDASNNARWGDANVSSSSGERIPHGTSIEIDSVADIWMVAEAGSPVMSCSQELR